MKAAVDMSRGVCPEDARGPLEDVGSQYVAQVTPRHRFTTKLDDLRLVHPIFNQPAAAALAQARWPA